MSLSEPKILLDRTTIATTVQNLARRISQDYPEGNLVLICILKGAFVFLSDLIRCLDIPVEIDFVRMASYGSGQVSSGHVRITKDIEIPVQGKDVLIVEDIVDTGWTLSYLMERLAGHHPKSASWSAMALISMRNTEACPTSVVWRRRRQVLESSDLYCTNDFIVSPNSHRAYPWPENSCLPTSKRQPVFPCVERSY